MLINIQDIYEKIESLKFDFIYLINIIKLQEEQLKENNLIKELENLKENDLIKKFYNDDKLKSHDKYYYD